MSIAREIRVFLFAVILAVVSVKVFFGWTPALILLAACLPVIYLFRVPACQVPSAPLAVLSPANGEIIALEPVEDPWLKRTATRCRIRMSFWHVHRLRSPIEGKIRNQWASNGGGEAGVRRRYTYWIQSDEGDDIIFSVATGRLAPFTRITLRCGERTGQGQPCGYLYFTGCLDVLFPEHTRIDLKVGQVVDAGESVLGQFIHKNGQVPVVEAAPAGASPGPAA